MIENYCIRRQVVWGAMAVMMFALVAGSYAVQEIKPPAEIRSKPTSNHQRSIATKSIFDPGSGVAWDRKQVGLAIGSETEAEDSGAGQSDTSVHQIRYKGIFLAPTRRQMARMTVLDRQLLVSDRVQRDPSDLSELSRYDPNDILWLGIGSTGFRANADRLLEPVFRLTGLQVLRLSQTGLTDKGMEKLRSLRSLRALMFSGEHLIPNPGLAVLKDLPNLEYLDLDTGATDVGLKHLAECHNLRWLRIRTGKIWGPGLTPLADLPHLERLCLWGTSQISDRHIQNLEGLTHLKGLTLWGVGGNLTDASLASIGKLKSLEELYFLRTRPQVTATGMAHLQGLKHLKRIELPTVSIMSNAAECDEVARQLATLPQLESIKGLLNVGPEGLKALATLPNLKSLDIGVRDFTIVSGDYVQYDGPTGLSYLSKKTSLEKLHLISRNVRDEDLVHLASLPNLKDLFISCQNVTDRGLASIAKLKQLESLSIWEAGVTRAGLNQLDSLTNLQSLNVNYYGSPTPVDELTLNLSALENLRSFSLSGFSMKPEDLAWLADARSLEHMTIQPKDPLPAASIRYLKDLPKLKSIHISKLVDCRAEDLAELSSLGKLDRVILAGQIPNSALPALGKLQSGRSLRVESDQPIRPRTITDLKQRLADTGYEFVRIENLPATVQRRQRTPVNSSRTNRRIQQDRRRSR